MAEAKKSNFFSQLTKAFQPTQQEPEPMSLGDILFKDAVTKKELKPVERWRALGEALAFLKGAKRRGVETMAGTSVHAIHSEKTPAPSQAVLRQPPRRGEKGVARHSRSSE